MVAEPIFLCFIVSFLFLSSLFIVSFLIYSIFHFFFFVEFIHPIYSVFMFTVNVHA
jgi:hypothetical protein